MDEVSLQKSYSFSRGISSFAVSFPRQLCMKIRNNIFNGPSVACTGPMQSMHALQNHSVV